MNNKGEIYSRLINNMEQGRKSCTSCVSNRRYLVHENIIVNYNLEPVTTALYKICRKPIFMIKMYLQYQIWSLLVTYYAQNVITRMECHRIYSYFKNIWKKINMIIIMKNDDTNDKSKDTQLQKLLQKHMQFLYTYKDHSYSNIQVCLCMISLIQS